MAKLLSADAFWAVELEFLAHVKETDRRLARDFGLVREGAASEGYYDGALVDLDAGRSGLPAKLFIVKKALLARSGTSRTPSRRRRRALRSGGFERPSGRVTPSRGIARRGSGAPTPSPGPLRFRT